MKSLPIVALSFAFLPVLRADHTWVGTDPGGALWSTAANWTGGTGDIMVFNATSVNLATTQGADQPVAGLKVVDPPYRGGLHTDIGQQGTLVLNRKVAGSAEGCLPHLPEGFPG